MWKILKVKEKKIHGEKSGSSLIEEDEQYNCSSLFFSFFSSVMILLNITHIVYLKVFLYIAYL